MREPKEPPYTCPSIDSVIKCLDELTRCGGAMEDIRSQNEALRSWGAYWKDRAEEAEDRVNELEKELDEALKSVET